MSIGIRVFAIVAALLAAYFAIWHYQQRSARAQANAFCDASPIGSDVAQAIARAAELKLIGGGYSEQQGHFLAIFRGAIFNAFICELTIAERKVTARQVRADGD